MSSRLVFPRSATRILTSCPSAGPVTSSLMTVKAGTPGGILGWSQHVFGPAAFSVEQLVTPRASTMHAAAPSGAVSAQIFEERKRIRDLLGASRDAREETAK